MGKEIENGAASDRATKLAQHEAENRLQNVKLVICTLYAEIGPEKLFFVL